MRYMSYYYRLAWSEFSDECPFRIEQLPGHYCYELMIEADMSGRTIEKRHQMVPPTSVQGTSLSYLGWPPVAFRGLD